MTYIPFKQGILRTTSAPPITIDPEKTRPVSVRDLHVGKKLEVR
jgi:hypothetical protein